MSAQLPTLLALAGVVLLAIAIFAPRRLPVRVERPSEATAAPAAASRPEGVPQWPQLVEPSAADCNATTRLDLVDALIALDSPWAREILLQALTDETDRGVRERISAALHASTPA